MSKITIPDEEVKRRREVRKEFRRFMKAGGVEW